jgi:hypothetical protein
VRARLVNYRGTGPEPEDQEQTIGYVETINGVAVPSNEKVRRLLSDTKVFEPPFINPDRNRPPLTYADGDRYVQALRYTFRGPPGGLGCEIVEGLLRP